VAKMNFGFLFKEPFVVPLLSTHNLGVFEQEGRAQWIHPCARAPLYTDHQDDEENDTLPADYLKSQFSKGAD